MSEHYWADGTLKGELETLLYGPVGGLLQRWQNKAIRKAMKQVDKVSELKRRFEEAERLIQHQEHSAYSLADEVAEARHDRDYWKGLAQSREELNEGLGNRVEQLESDLAATRKQLAETQADLSHLAEYWNRDENEMAMKDACWHTVEVAEASDTSALSAAIEAAVEPYKPLISAGMYQFLSDVVTSAGVLRHGKTDKGLSERISASAMMFMGVVAALSAKEAP